MIISRIKEVGAYRGWLMVAIAFVCIVFVFGAPTASMPLIYGPVMHEFGWTRSAATLATTYKNAVSALMALFLIGPFLDRFGLRSLFIIACVSVGGGMTAFLWVDGLTSYYLASALIGVGTATIMIATKVLVSRWFISHQGFAIGLTAAGASLGGIIFPLAGATLIEQLGWRTAFAVMSLGIWFIALPVYLFLARETPSEADIAPDAPKELKGDTEMQEKLRAADVDLSFGQILRMPMFWFVTTGVMLASAADAGVFQNTILFLEGDLGLSKSVAAVSLSGVFALGICAKVAAGWVFDRFSLRGIQFWYLLLAVSILLAFFVTGFPTLLLFTIARGLAHGGLMSEGPVLAKQCFGPRHLNKMLPIFVGTYSIGASLGPVLLSHIRDTSGSYNPGFFAAAAACVIAAFMLLGATPLYWNNLRKLRREQEAPAKQADGKVEAGAIAE